MFAPTIRTVTLEVALASAPLYRAVRIVLNGVQGELYSARILDRGRVNKGKLHVIICGIHLGSSRVPAATFNVEPGTLCNVTGEAMPAGYYCRLGVRLEDGSMAERMERDYTQRLAEDAEYAAEQAAKR